VAVGNKREEPDFEKSMAFDGSLPRSSIRVEQETQDE
jgi:hypothetical protein